MRKYLGHILLLTVLVTVPACEKQGVGLGVLPEQVPVQMAMCVGGSSAATKGDTTVVKELQKSPGFSGLSSIVFLPYSSADATKTLENSIPRFALSADALPTNHARLFTEKLFTVPRKTDAFLVYGKVRKSGDQNNMVEFKHKNGSLVEQGLDVDVPQPASIGFTPETMLTSSETPSHATHIAQALKAVVIGDPFSVSVTYGSTEEELKFQWNGEIGDANLRECYENITAGGALIPGSGTNVESMLTNLYRALADYTSINSNPYEIEKNGTIYTVRKKSDNSVLTYGDIYNGVKGVVLNRITNAVSPSDGESKFFTVSGTDTGDPKVAFNDASLKNYPESYGLPSGAAVVRWTPSGYVVPIEKGLDGIAPISAYCYPPSMYYYADSGIRTSNEEIVQEDYNAGDWSTILAKYKDGDVVSSTTSAVALKDPLRFAVALLECRIKASADKLDDNDGQPYTLVDVSGTNFPLTGVIVGRQYPQHYNFTPDFHENDKQYYLYDNQIPGGIYLTKTAWSAPFRTLSLQTPEGKDTYFCLEFLNDSSQSFYGAEGRILPGHKFYLVGKLDAPGEGEARKEIFTKGYKTTVKCTISSLKDAHSAVPDMGIPLLTLGVDTVVDWNLSTPTTLMFE